MTLRLRLALAATAALLPTSFVLLWYSAATVHRSAETILAEHTYSEMTRSRAACEKAPDTWGGDSTEPPRRPPPPDDLLGDPRGNRPPPPDGPRADRPPPPPGGDGRSGAVHHLSLFAYDADLRAKSPLAPPIPSALLRAIKRYDVGVAPMIWPSSTVEILVRTPWATGPCAYVLARGVTDPPFLTVLLRRPLWLLPVAFVLAAILLAMGPVVRRIRRLTAAVKRSSESSYAGSIALPGTDEIAELSHAFDAAATEIRAQLTEKARREQALRDFVAATTHDVMVPLTVLQGHLATLRESAGSTSPPDREVLTSAMNEAHYMASLIHNLTTVARLEGDEVKIQPSDVDLGALVTRVTGRHRPIARELGVTVESAIPEDPLVVRADLTLIEQAFSNVVYNAVRYNRRGGHVAVILDRAAPTGFSLRVIDDGPGIPEADLSKIVQRGYRGDLARTRAPDGQGLGLHIAFRATRIHGFTMHVGPSEHGGLEVRFTGD